MLVQNEQDLVNSLKNISATLNMINTNLAALQNIGGSTASISASFGWLTSLVDEMKKRDEAERIEAERTNRDGEWGVEWYVEIPPRDPYKFDTDQEAYTAARSAAAGLAPGTPILVYSREVKRYEPEKVNASEWRTDPEEDNGTSPS